MGNSTNSFYSKDAPETVLCIGNKLDISQQLVTKIGDFLDQVPRYFWGDEFYSPDPKSEKNKNPFMRLEISLNFNYLMVVKLLLVLQAKMLLVVYRLFLY